jgi:hypothetical protein
MLLRTASDDLDSLKLPLAEDERVSEPSPYSSVPLTPPKDIPDESTTVNGRR